MSSNPAGRKRPSMVALTAKVTAIAAAAAIALTGGLAIQMASGKDPALAPKVKQQARDQTNVAPAQVVTRTS